MSLSETERRAHWDSVYTTKQAAAVSWFQDEPTISLKLIRRTQIARDAPIVDIGGGASTLVDHLLRDSFSNVSVLDIAAPGLEQAKQRLAADSERVTWIVADITAWRPAQSYTLWHDRAVLHFLTEANDQAAYAAAIRAALRPGGWAIIGGFAPNGPVQCSGLNVVQHDGHSLSRLLGDDFALMETHGEIHLTPQGREQAFRYHLFARR